MNTEYQQLKFRPLNGLQLRFLATIQLINSIEVIDFEKGKKKKANISKIVCIN